MIYVRFTKRLRNGEVLVNGLQELSPCGTCTFVPVYLGTYVPVYPCTCVDFAASLQQGMEVLREDYRRIFSKKHRSNPVGRIPRMNPLTIQILCHVRYCDIRTVSCIRGKASEGAETSKDQVCYIETTHKARHRMTGHRMTRFTSKPHPTLMAGNNQ